MVEDGESDLAEIIGDFDAIVVRSATTLDASLIELATRLRVIGRAGVGVDNVDVDAATRRGIVVANAAESTVDSAAEHAIALMLALVRNVPQAHAALKAGTWDRARFTGIEVAGKTLGVLGLGRIGRQVAHRALGLGMRVVAYDPFVAAERFRELGVEARSSLNEVYAEADLVTLHLPLNDETRGLLDAEAFAQMKDGVRIVNAARGGLVDEEALADAIRSGKVAGAALDVFATEPYAGPLLELPQVVVTPHLAGSTAEAQDRAGVVIAEQVAAALAGEVVRTAVNIPVVDPRELEVLGPFVPLASKLARLAMALAGAWPSRIAVAVHGPLSEHDTRLLTVAALNGAFQGRVDEAVNEVNAPLIAAERGIEVSEQRFAGVSALHEPRARRRHGGWGGGRRRRNDGRARAAPLPRGCARLLDRHRARTAHGVPLVRRRAGRDRHGRDDVRRGGREHREHGRLEDDGGREGAHGVLDRLSGARGAHRARRGGRFRRRPVHSPWLRSRLSARVAVAGSRCSLRFCSRSSCSVSSGLVGATPAGGSRVRACSSSSPVPS